MNPNTDELQTSESTDKTNTEKIGEQGNLFMKARESVTNWNKIFKLKIQCAYENLQSDLVEVAEKEEEEVKESEVSIDVLQLRKNLIHIADLTDPIITFLNETRRVFRWENPAISFIVFITYMNTVYKGWLLTLFMIIFTLILLYFYFTSRHEDNTDSENEIQAGTNLKLKNQVALTVFILKKYQISSRKVLGILQKIKNLLLWRQPEITQFVFTTIAVCTLSSFVFSATEIINFAAYYAGVHAFMINNVFLRYPRLARKYDKFAIFWNRLMTDDQYDEWKKTTDKENQSKTQEIQLNKSIPSKRYIQFPSPTNSNSKNISSMLKVPLPEPPLSEWRGGRRCTLVTRSIQSTTDNTSIGLLYLTERFLCFEGAILDKSNASFIPLDIITKVEKVNIHTSFICAGKGISITIFSAQKVLTFMIQSELFSTILNRDEAYEKLIAIGKRNHYPWVEKN